MHDLLLHEAMFRRIEGRLIAHEAAIRPLLANDAGAIRAGWGAPLEGPAQPHILFATMDVFFSPAVRTIMQTAIASPRLVWFQSGAAGIENRAFIPFGRKAEIYTSCHAQAAAIAEWVVWAAFDFFRRGPERRADQAARHWRRLTTREVSGSEWVIAGFGEIGRETARRVRALGGRVTGVRRSPGPDPDADAIAPPTDLPALLPQADVVLLCAPHTPETEKMANASFFAAMKKDALFVNVGRGALVVEPDLLSALDGGRPAFAALDVFETEPLPDDSPFWAHPNVMVSPHNSPQTAGTVRRIDHFMLEQLGRYLAGEQLLYIEPKERFT